MSHFSIRIRQIPHIILLESVGRDKITWSNSQQYVYYQQLQASGPSIIIGPAARAFLRPQEDLWRAWGNVCREGVALIMSLDPLTRRSCLFIFFSPSHTNFVVGEETPVQKCWYLRPTRMQLPINRPIRSEKVLNSNRDLIIHVFKSLIVAFIFSSHKPFNVYFVPFGELL